MAISSTKTRLVTGYAAHTQGKPLQPLQYELASVGSWDVEVEILFCGLCHTDLSLINNERGDSIYPLVPGHEIVGRVRDKGNKVEQFQLGDLVGIGYQSGSCQKCAWCRKGMPTFCEKPEFTCIGRPGGFSEAIVVDSRFAFHIPKELSPEIAAPLLCGGATVFTPLIDNHANPTKHVGIIGIGGLGHLAIQFAHAMGCKVSAFSTSQEKEREAKALGADQFIVTSNRNALEKARGTIDLLLNTSSSKTDVESFFEILRPDAVICNLGGVENRINIPLRPLVSKKYKITGSHIGDPELINDMLNFAARAKIAPRIELFDLSDINRATRKLAANDIRYRAVIKMK